MVGIAGSDFCLIAADTRLAATEQYFIRSRNTSRVFEVRWIIIHIDDNGLIFKSSIYYLLKNRLKMVYFYPAVAAGLILVLFEILSLKQNLSLGIICSCSRQIDEAKSR